LRAARCCGRGSEREKKNKREKKERVRERGGPRFTPVRTRVFVCLHIDRHMRVHVSRPATRGIFFRVATRREREREREREKEREGDASRSWKRAARPPEVVARCPSRERVRKGGKELKSRSEGPERRQAGSRRGRTRGTARRRERESEKSGSGCSRTRF